MIRLRMLLPALLLLAGCLPQMIQPESGRVTPELKAHSFVSFDGASLPLRRWLPQGRSDAVVIALHGFNDYSNFIRSAAAWWSQRNIAVYAYDQRGFGAAPDRGLWPGRDAFALDLAAMVQLVRQRHPDRPIYLLGESMGAAVVLYAMTTRKMNVAGVILAAPAVWGWESMPWWQRWGLGIAAYTVPWMKFTGESLEIMASDNIEMLRALGRDPLVIKQTRVDTIYGLVNLMQAGFDAVDALEVPALILYGDKDEVIPRRPVLETFAPLVRRNAHQRLLLYQNGYHMLLRDLQAEVVWSDIVGWIADNRATLPSQQAELSRQLP